MKRIQNNTKKYLYGYEVFYLYYYGINIFLGVGEVDLDTKEVYVYEIATEYYEDLGVESLLWDNTENTFLGKTSQKRYIVPDDADNRYLGKAMKVKPIVDGDTYLLPIEIKIDSDLYKLASQINKGTLPVGVYYAQMICDGTKQQIANLMDTGFETKVIPWRANPQA